MPDEMSHLEITVFLWEDNLRDWADMLRDIANKLEANHTFSTEDKWYDADGYTIAQFRKPEDNTPHIGRIYGLN